jgi:hypothetical protein
MLLLIVTPGIAAEESHGTFTTTVYCGSSAFGNNGDFTFSSLVYFKFWWKLWSMMGEPVEDYRAVWGLPAGATVVLSDVYAKKLGISGIFTVPMAVMEKLRIDVLLWAQPNMANMSNFGLYLDPGIMTRPFVGITNEKDLTGTYQALSADDRGKKVSFNSPGSPNWNDLFRMRVTNSAAGSFTLPPKIAALDREAAKLVMRKGIPGLSSITPVKVAIDFSPVRSWLQDIAKQEADKRKAALDQKAADLRVQEKKLDDRLAAMAAQKAEKQKKAEADDFWNTPADAETSAEREQRLILQSQKSGMQTKKNELTTQTSALAQTYTAISLETDTYNRERDSFGGENQSKSGTIAPREEKTKETVRSAIKNKIDARLTELCGYYPIPTIYLISGNPSEEQLQLFNERRDRELKERQDAWREKAKAAESDPVIIDLRQQLVALEAEMKRWGPDLSD